MVTGASRGLGRAYALELAARGANLVLVARSGAALRELATTIRDRHGVKVEAIPADLAAPSAVDALAMPVDLLLNNAAYGPVGPFFGRPFEQNLRAVALNVTGLMTLTHRIGREMLARGSGGIINVASTAAFQPMPYQAGYAATKAFVLSFTEALAEETRGSGVRIMAAHPGAVDTGFFDGTTATIDPRFADSPESVAAKTLDDFARGRTVSYPGRLVHRVATWAPRALPRRAVTRITGGLNRHNGLHEAADT
ncbi:SDR family NAD(P)-dependent oxidoreductase [Amycolatopsis sacchari]|uniref:Short-chain dehydrogenase n=1 Tax=Amycolatopsis sacchari TaxID=115433 RepID=A0A1I3SL16_9PSEU|nr:SDR family NAD(P)-dependent oxidoreductase [Amycolatopsis sacchari]SFJ58379.1 hypothetical protein SAMN05421835_106340 [Amycolatopsis sacchari]